jgi:endonuclease/exonuclease/phosphatase family metal-dependent hydrolase
VQKLLLILVTFSLPLAPSITFQLGRENLSLARHPDSKLLEIGRASRINPAAASPSEIKIVSYNIRWRSGLELHKLAQLLKTDPEIGGASIIGMQEVDRHKVRSGKTNTAKILAEELGMFYTWAAPPAPKSDEEEETGVVILSAYPLADVHRIVLPHEGPGKRRRVALGATIRIGPTSLRVYAVHSETRIPVDKKLEQMKAVLDDLARYPKEMPAIVFGDLNTWEQDAVEKTFKLFTAAHLHTPFDDQPTFYRRALFVSIDLKLDWIWLRNLGENRYGIDREIGLSDHWPLWVVLGMKTSLG